MKTIQLLAWVALLILPAAVNAHGYGRSFVSVGVNVGPPCRPWGCGPWWGYGWYRPYPAVYYGVYVPPPAPGVIVQPAPVVVQPAPVPVVTETPPPPLMPVPRSATAGVSNASVVSREGNSAIDEHLRNLADPDEGMRQNAVLELGRMHVDRAIDPLTATLAGDASPAVRETAARALGLIASPRALPALTRAAQADSDRDVRRSAQFAVEIIHGRLRER